MSELIQVRKKAQITLPQSVREQLGIEEGDYLETCVQNGEVILKVKKLIDKDQVWFWTERWQKGEKEAEEDIQAGRTERFPNSEEAISFLYQTEKNKKAKTKKDVR